MDHGPCPCVENLAAVVHVAQQAGVLVVGKELRAPDLVRLQEGQAMVPELLQRTPGNWYPTDLVNPPPQHDSPWRQARWHGGQGLLARPDTVTASQAATPAAEPLDQAGQ